MTVKTLHITNSFHASSGGVRTVYLSLLEAANRRRRPMRLLVPGRRDKVTEVGEFGRIYQVKAPRALRFLDAQYRMILPHRYLLSSTSRIWEIVRREQPDLVEVSEKWATVYVGGMLRAHLVRGVDRPALVGTSFERMDDNVAAYLSGGRRARRFSRWYMREVYIPQFDVHIANSVYTAEELRAVAGPRLGERVFTLPHGVHSGVFRPDRRDPRVRQRWLAAVGAPADATLLVYAGRLAREKNAELLVETLEKLAASGDRDYHLLIAGSGPLRESLRDRAAGSVPGRAHFLGHVGGREDLAGLLANADVFLHPNPREPFGIGPLEAMASDLALVGPRSGGILTYADDDNAWLARPTARAFAGAVRAALDNPDLRRRRALQGRQTAERLDWEAVAGTWFELYDRAVMEHRAWQRSWQSEDTAVAAGARPARGGPGRSLRVMKALARAVFGGRREPHASRPSTPRNAQRPYENDGEPRSCKP